MITAHDRLSGQSWSALIWPTVLIGRPRRNPHVIKCGPEAEKGS